MFWTTSLDGASVYVETSREVAQTAKRLRKIERLAALLETAPTDQIEFAVAYLTGSTLHGRVGVGPALLQDILSTTEPAGVATLTLEQVDETLREIRTTVGAGSGRRRRALAQELMDAATSDEQAFLAQLFVGEVRQGALEGVMVDAIARAAGVPSAKIRRAAMLAADIAEVAGTAIRDGSSGLRRFRLSVLEPIRPMLAQSSDDVGSVLARFGIVALEHKLDGVRVQLHKAEDEVRVFTRRLHDVTASVPELVMLARKLPARHLILDGEALVLRPDGTPQPFQVTMRRFGRKRDVERIRVALPLSVFFFDCLHKNGADLIDRSSAERYEELAACVSRELLVPRCLTTHEHEANAFLSEALSSGHEGIMIKSLDALYEAGNRGSGWIKLKPSQTLDLVVLAAEWGHGRRRGWLSNLHLGARDPVGGGFVMLGKTFKGLTDDMLAWQTQYLSRLALGNEGGALRVRPGLVVEVAFNEIQESPQYPAGLALRFARVKQYRLDKSAADCDTIETVRAIFQRKMGAA